MSSLGSQTPSYQLMMRLFAVLTIVVQTVIWRILASPLQRRVANCLDPGAPYDESCWATLELSTFVPTWKTNTPACTDADDGTSCCNPSSSPDEPWTTCFLRIALGNADYDCSVINGDSCSLPGFILDSELKLSTTEAAKYRYVVRNIYAMTNLFNTWYTSMNYAVSQAALFIQPLVNKVDPEKKTNVFLEHLLTALSIGLAFLGLPQVGGQISSAITSTAANLVTNVLLTSLQQAPLVGKALWPSGTESSKAIQIANLATELSSLSESLSSMLDRGLSVLMSDVDSFLGFASTGHFSTSEAPSIPAQTANLDMGLRTYLLTTALDANGIGGTTNPLATDPFWVEHYSKCMMTEANRCAGDYWSVYLGQDFELAPLTLNGPDWGDMMQWIEETSGVTLGSVFDNAFRCTRDHGSQPASLVNFNADGTLDLTCLSRIKMTMNCGWPCLSTIPPGGTCPFPVVAGEQWKECTLPAKQCGEHMSLFGHSGDLNQQCDIQ